MLFGHLEVLPYYCFSVRPPSIYYNAGKRDWGSNCFPSSPAKQGRRGRSPDSTEQVAKPSVQQQKPPGESVFKVVKNLRALLYAHLISRFLKAGWCFSSYIPLGQKSQPIYSFLVTI